MTADTRHLVLEMRGISKRFPGVDALMDASLRVEERQIVGLVGENGAGKSTLAKILMGLYQPDCGEILMHGRPITPANVKEAEDCHGIGMLFQEQALLGNLSVAQNMFLGSEQPFGRGGLINGRKMRAAAQRIIGDLGSSISARAQISDLSFAERQIVELARAWSVAGRCEYNPVIIFDEATSLGTAEDVEQLFKVMRTLKERGSMIFISHRLEEILEITDHVFVMKDGRTVADMPTSSATEDELHRLMVGRHMSAEYYRESEQKSPDSDVVLSLHDCSRTGRFKNVSLDLRRGEILGITGVAGSGRESLCRALGGIEPITEGEILVGGTKVTLKSPADATAHKIAYMPVDRRAESLIQYLPIAPNVTLPCPSLAVRRGVVSRRRERRVAEEWMQKLRVKARGAGSLVSTLSGGNQQKIVLAKWLAAGSKIIVMDHPTRGIDVGAKEEVYLWIRKLTEEGHSIVLSGDTLGEVIGLSNRVVVMKDGEVQHIFESPPGGKPDEVDVVEYML